MPARPAVPTCPSGRRAILDEDLVFLFNGKSGESKDNNYQKNDCADNIKSLEGANHNIHSLSTAEKAYQVFNDLSNCLALPAYARESNSPSILRLRSGLGTGPDILWDKIVSIEYVGYEQVYDIEVEGTPPLAVASTGDSGCCRTS